MQVPRHIARGTAGRNRVAEDLAAVGARAIGRLDGATGFDPAQDCSASGAVIFAIGLAPIHGKTSRSSRRTILSACVGAHFGERFAIHPRAHASNESACAGASALRFSPGSMPGRVALGPLRA